ncbi:MAG: class I SAM-dependent methyltransferase [Akkermansiaceae bacterium]|nr:class I SAM-dependent methyltransferase [Akkermansiaceae bacterium]
MSQLRAIARQLARDAVAAGRPLDWFEDLYVKAEAGEAAVPWADRVPNPNVTAFLDARGVSGAGRKALKVGSGIGDDAEYLADLGFAVTAFDISETAIAVSRERFPESRVDYRAADLFEPPEEWRGAFDFVWESYTLQVLPPDLRHCAIRQIAEFVAPGGELIVVTRAREDGDPEGEMPWPLTRDELRRFEDAGLVCASLEDYADSEAPPVRRFRALYRREVMSAARRGP